MLSKCFHFNNSSDWFLLGISIRNVPFFSFLTVFGLRFLDSIFLILNGDSLLRISSVDSITMKDGKVFGFSSISLSELPIIIFFISLGFICISHMNNYEFH